jgi:hypothetical protein
MTTSEISDKNVVMASFDNMSEEILRGEGDTRASCMVC